MYYGDADERGSTEPLGLVFDPEAKTRRELVAERLAEVRLSGFA